MSIKSEHDEARAEVERLRPHATVSNPEGVRALSAANVRYGRARAAVAALGASPEELGRAAAMTRDVSTALERSFIGPENSKGRAAVITLSPEQFAAHQAGQS